MGSDSLLLSPEGANCVRISLIMGDSHWRLPRGCAESAYSLAGPTMSLPQANVVCHCNLQFQADVLPLGSLHWNPSLTPLDLAHSLWVTGTVSHCSGLFSHTCRGGVKQVQEKVFTSDSFSQLDLHPHLVSARLATRSLCSSVRLFYWVVFSGSLFGRVCVFQLGDELLEDIPPVRWKELLVATATVDMD